MKNTSNNQINDCTNENLKTKIYEEAGYILSSEEVFSLIVNFETIINDDFGDFVGLWWDVANEQIQFFSVDYDPEDNDFRWSDTPNGSIDNIDYFKYNVVDSLEIDKETYERFLNNGRVGINHYTFVKSTGKDVYEARMYSPLGEEVKIKSFKVIE